MSSAVSGSANVQWQQAGAVASHGIWPTTDFVRRAVAQTGAACVRATRSRAVMPPGGGPEPEAKRRISDPTHATPDDGRRDVSSLLTPARERPWRKHSRTIHA